MANIFSNFGTKVGNAFTNLGQGGNLFNANPTEIAALSEEDRRRLKREGLERFANSIGVAAAIGSGDPQRIAMAQNKMRQAKIDKENAKAKAEQEAQQEKLMKDREEFMKTLDPNSDLAQKIKINELFGFTPSTNTTKLTKSDFVVEILEKMKKNPGYELTETDQRILDTISDTDPMKIMIRNRLKEMQTSKFNNENTTQTGPVTVTTQQEFDALPSGSLFIEDGKTYRKP